MSTKVISFFSYKGGAGRSTLAYNIIPILAAEHFHPTKNSPIIIVDMDLDSCGMSYLLEVENDITDENCVQHLLNAGFDNECRGSISEHTTFKTFFPVGNKFGYPENEAILFLPAKDMKNVNSNGSSNYSDANNPFKPKLQDFIEICKEYDVPAIIFDSSVGNNGTANVVNQLSNIIVCCMRPTTQFVNGTVRYLNSFESVADGRKKIVLVPNVVPQEETIIDEQRYPMRAIDRILDKFMPLIQNGDDLFGVSYEDGMLDYREFGIPAVKSFMWREGQLYTQRQCDENENLVLERYKKLSNIIGNL